MTGRGRASSLMAKLKKAREEEKRRDEEAPPAPKPAEGEDLTSMTTAASEMTLGRSVATTSSSSSSGASKKPGGGSKSGDTGSEQGSLTSVTSKVQGQGQPGAGPRLGGVGRAALLQRATEAARLRDAQEKSSSDGSHQSVVSEPKPKPAQVKPVSTLPEVKAQPAVAKQYRGSGGKTITASSNYMVLNIVKGMGVFEYEVSFEPRVDSRDERFKLLNQKREEIGTTKVFDGVKLYLPKELPSQSQVYEVKHSMTGDMMKMTLTFKYQRRSGDREVVQLYNILFRRIFKALKFSEHNRKNFDPEAAHKIPAHKLEVWPGYVTAVDFYEGGLLLQIDVANRVLRTQNVRDALVEMARKAGKDGLKNAAEKELLGTSVVTKYSNKSYMIDDIDFEASPKSTFKNAKGESVSYIDYYKNQWGITIKDLDQPMLINRPRKKASNVKEEEVRILCLVPELCILTGLTDSMRADFKVMKAVADFTRVAPGVRQQTLINFIGRIKKNEEALSHLKNWGLELADRPMDLQARQLAPEKLFFGKGYSEMVNAKGDWGRTATSRAVLTPVNLQKWAIFFVDKNKAIAQGFCKTLQQQGPKMDIKVANPKVIALPNDRTETYLKAMRESISPDLQLVLAIFPQMRSDRYAALKKLCCVEKPIASQVINLKTISNEKKLCSVVQKVALQINCKLGGELWGCALPQQMKRLMVVGIDVYHEKSRNAGSIAGVVSSMNGALSRFYSNVVVQKQGQEIVDALQTAFLDALVKYHEANNAWPEQIVVFRDGVGDGQIETTEKYEAQQFLSSFSLLTEAKGEAQKKLKSVLPKNYSPNFTFIVVQKRINTRVFAARPGPGGKRDYENPPSGTVLDHTVTRFHYKDFFLVPQNVNMGTVTPTHYVIVKEHSGKPGLFVLGATEVQQLAYKLSHMYFNWPGTVRVPAPCQYAHKLVDLIGEHVHKEPSATLNDKLYFL